ncbi:MAG: hypothetical protein IID50_14155, partial [Proteobacteria bacterium]|nr:hypothetical protein [Pseudomonadota bacterium]
LPRLSDGVAHPSRCPASPQRTLRAENLGKPARRVMISAPWYYTLPSRVGLLGGPGLYAPRGCAQVRRGGARRRPANILELSFQKC